MLCVFNSELLKREGYRGTASFQKRKLGYTNAEHPKTHKDPQNCPFSEEL